MSSFLVASLNWLRRPAWGEVLALSLPVVGAVGLAAFGSRLAGGQRAFLWGLLILAAAVLLRQGWAKLFGPVLLHDMVRTARRRRYVAIRVSYVLVLFFVLMGHNALWCLRYNLSFWDTLFQPALAAGEMAEFAMSFFYVFVGIQLVVIFGLAPAYTAGAIAEEIERRTLEDLFATDLRNREIVLSLFVSRLANLGLILLAGWPILAALQFLGGVDPSLVLASYAVTGLTVVAVASISLYYSLQARRAREAVLRTYFIIGAYLAVTGASWILLIPTFGLSDFPSTDSWSSPIVLEDVVSWISAGNIFALIGQIGYGVTKGARLEDLLAEHLTAYAWLSLAITVFCCAWVTTRLRVAVLRPNAEAATRDRSSRWLRLGFGFRPPVSDRPLIWKEVFVDSGSRRGLLGRALQGLFVAALLAPGLHLMYVYDRILPMRPDDRMSQLVNFWMRGACSLLGMAMLLQVAMRSAGSVCRERDRDTLDGLMASPLRNQEILSSKWIGSLASPGGAGWLLLLAVWTVGWMGGSLHWLAVPCFLALWLLFATFAAGLGLWFSVANRSSRGATFGTLFALGAVMATALLVAHDFEDAYASPFLAFSATPPVALAMAAFSPLDLEEYMTLGARTSVIIVCAVLVWIGLTALLWKLANIRFQVVTGRVPAPAEPDVAIESTLSDAERAAAMRLWERVDKSAKEAGPNQLQRRDRLARFALRAAHVTLLLLPLSLLIGTYLWLRIDADELLRTQLAETDRLDPNWRIEEVEARRRTVAPEQDSGIVLIRVKKLMPPNLFLGGGVDQSISELAPQTQLLPEQTAFLRDALERAKDAIVEARKLKDFPNGRLPIHYSDDGISTTLEHTQSAREVVNLLQCEAKVRAQEKDAVAALEACLGMVNSGRALMDEPLMVSQLVHVAVIKVSTTTLERVLAQGEGVEPLLARLQELLLDEGEQNSFLVAARGERGIMERFLESLVNGGENGIGHVMFNSRKQPRWTLQSEEVALLLAGSLKGQHAAVLQNLNEMVEQAKAPWHEYMKDLLSKDTSGKGALALANAPPTRLPMGLARWLLPASGRVRDACARHTADTRAAAIGVALERFRLRHGRWPESLEELTPAFVKQVPIDPFIGEPLRYKRTAEGVVVYSVGPDCQDNGGTIKRLNWPAQGLDLGFRLFDVDKRRQAPVPEKKASKPEEP